MNRFDPDVILSVLDQCCDTYTFPMLDNGYVYLAATRLSLFRSPADWALVIEVFGFSPRAGLPSTHIHTFASRLHDRDAPDGYRSREAYENYLANYRNNESRFVNPVPEGPWQDPDDHELVASDAHDITVRESPRPIPAVGEYARYGIDLVEAPRVRVFELCRFLAEVVHNDTLATPAERRISVVPGMAQILQLEEWHHPNVVDADDRPSGSPTFRQLAQVLATGDVSGYRPSVRANTHWRNWPDGGSL
jgi:hypothetical protein